MVSSVEQRPTFQDAALHREIMRLREVDNHTNLLFLAVEYLSLAIVMAGAVVFAEYRDSWGLSWFWNVPVFAIAIILIGGIQHRLAGLGHESSHYSFMKNRTLNDLIPDLFCMFPLFTTIHFYRLFHMGHHQFTNDPARDPDLQNLGHGKRADEFPMGRRRFITVVYFCFLVAPIRFLRYQWAYFTVNTLGKGKNVYIERAAGDGKTSDSRPRLATVLGILYAVVLEPGLEILDRHRLPAMAGPCRAGRDRACSRSSFALLPDWAVFQSPFRQAYSPRVAGFLRMAYYTAVLVALAHLRWATGGRSAIYPVLLWVVPLQTSFMFFMFLRDVYQHSNADDWPADQLAGLLHRPVHSLGRLRVRAGHAHPTSPFPGGSALSPAKPA